MVGIVIVSHSASIAAGVVELAREMGGPDVALEPAGGIDEPEHPLGTDAVLVAKAIERSESGGGVLVLMDLGSAVLSAETALELLPEGLAEGVLLCEAPLVEGAVAAAVAARGGLPLDQVAAEARDGLRAKAEHLGAEEKEAGEDNSGLSRDGVDAVEARITVTSPHGLHARPAARFVRTASGFDAEVEVSNPANGRGPASARSLNALATLAVRQGQEVLVRAAGPAANEVLAALEALAASGFGEGEEPGDPVTSPRERLPQDPPDARPVAAGTALQGLPASPGLAVERVRRYDPSDLEPPTHPAGQPDAEWRALELALERARDDVQQRLRSAARRASEQDAAIFDAHLLMLEDAAILEPVRRSVDGGVNAAQAWSAAVAEAAKGLRETGEPYLEARAGDVDDVGRTVLEHLLGVAATGPVVDSPCVLVAAELAPSETASLDPELVRALVTARGGLTSHSAILARSLGIPAVVGLGAGALAIAEGTRVAVDGEAGLVHVDPDGALVADFERRGHERADAERDAHRWAHEPAVTRDGRWIEVVANAGSRDDVARALAAGAEGIGLLRTELLFAQRDDPPAEDEIEAALRAVAQALGGRPLIVRTLDAGADKPLRYLPQPPEDNPFLGVRGIRLALAEPELFSTQLRAILRVAADHPLKVMFPMVATLAELRRARALLDEARAAVARAGVAAPNRFEVGVMVEVPALALCADRFAAEVDFFSLGTNDLAQYTLAAERGNPRVAALADGLEPAVLELIRRVVDAAEARGRWVGVCGELAGDPLAVPVLVGLGVRELSASAPTLPLVKRAVRSLSFPEARALAVSALGLDSAAAVRELVSAGARPASRSAASGPTG